MHKTTNFFKCLLLLLGITFSSCVKSQTNLTDQVVFTNQKGVGLGVGDIKSNVTVNGTTDPYTGYLNFLGTIDFNNVKSTLKPGDFIEFNIPDFASVESESISVSFEGINNPIGTLLIDKTSSKATLTFNEDARWVSDWMINNNTGKFSFNYNIKGTMSFTDGQSKKISYPGIKDEYTITYQKTEHDITGSVNFLKAGLGSNGNDNIYDNDQSPKGPVKQIVLNYILSGLFDISSLKGNIKDGDFFTVVVPPPFKVSKNSTTNIIVDGTVIGKMEVDMVTNTMKATFNENAKNVANINGRYNIPVSVTLKDGESVVIHHPNGKDQTILYTQKIDDNTPPQEEKVENEVFYKDGGTLSSDPEHMIWYVRINRIKQDMGTSEVIVRDNIKSDKGTLISYLIDSFELIEAEYLGDPTELNPSYRIGKKITITTNEEEYRNAPADTMAFLKITNEGKGFDLFLGNNIHTKSFHLTYKTTQPKDGSKITNGAKILVNNEETKPYTRLNGKDKNDYETSTEVTSSKDASISITIDRKSKIWIKKYDGDNSTTLLKGAEFSVEKVDNPSVSFILKTNDIGEVLSDPLDAGQYKIKEIIPPTGYDLNEKEYITNVEYNKDAIVINIPNYKTLSIPTVKFTADIVWIGGKEPRPTVELILTRVKPDGSREDVLSAERKTLVSGQTSVSWDRLPEGKYEVKQVGANGYITTYNHQYSNYRSIVTNSTGCVKPANMNDLGLDTRMGITLLKRAGNTSGSETSNDWPMLRKGAWIALESNTKGFVITRLNTNQINSLTPQEGMMVYDTDAKCLKIYNGTKWSCFSTPACPSN